ncbi:MAG: hypothetical protein LC789_17615, partial [Actinobacteria bacterium]|nr:hypothetical protein [Actinomycetota bacterium]
GKTRLIRTIGGLLDAWTPVVAGCEINDHPYAPVCVRCQRLVAAEGDATPVSWLARDGRYGEKLATPDTSVGDLIGDVDPIKVAEGRTLGDPETVHYGLVPRTNRGVFSINELPDLAERIQVALLNVLEERDIQVRGYRLRLPLDLLLVASANPEDYTNRGRIITPLKDRFGAEVRTHYPLRLDDEIALIRQEAVVSWPGSTHAAPVLPDHLLEIVARYTRLVRDSAQVDQRSGVSARFAVAGAETVAASAVRRAAVTGEAVAVARVCDLPAVVPASRGKVEFEAAEEGRELEVLAHLLRKATADTFRARLAGVDLSGLQARFDEGATVETGDLVPAADLLERLGTVPGCSPGWSRSRCSWCWRSAWRRRARRTGGCCWPWRSCTWSSYGPSCGRSATRRSCAEGLRTRRSWTVARTSGEPARVPVWVVVRRARPARASVRRGGGHGRDR